MTNTTSYKITLKDLDECWDFSIGYFLNPKKGVVDRTNLMERGLGGILDSFMKKLHEIAVREIIKKHNKNIRPITDFELHDIGKTQGDNRTEPDIIKVFRPGFLEKDYNLLINSVTIQQNSLESKKNSLKIMKTTKLQLPKIKNCVTLQEKEATRKKLKHCNDCLKKIKLDISTIKIQLNTIKKNIEKFEKAISPKLYVEIKNTGLGDAWIGPKLSEVDSITSRNNVQKKSIYYVYCRIVSAGRWKSDSEKKTGRKADPLGVFLKKFVNRKNMKKFHDVNDLNVEIQNVMSVNDIEKHGTFFPKGTIIPNPKIITFPGKDGTPYSDTKVQELIDDGTFSKITLPDKELPKQTSAMLREKQQDGTWKNVGWANYPDALGDFIFSGNVETYSEKHGSLRRLWIKCISSVTISNKVIGNKKLKKGDIVCYQIHKKGRIDKKNVDDIWISVHNASIMNKFTPTRISEIARKI